MPSQLMQSCMCIGTLAVHDTCMAFAAAASELRAGELTARGSLMCRVWEVPRRLPCLHTTDSPYLHSGVDSV